MKIKNGEIFNSREALEKLVKMPLPVRASYQVAKLASSVNDRLKAIDEARNNLVKQHGEADEKGQKRVTSESPNWAAFVKDFDELMDIEEEFAFEKVKLPEKIAGTCDACHHNMDVVLQLEPAMLMALERFVEVV